MSTTVNIIIWWTGAIAALAVLLICTIALTYGLKVWTDRMVIKTLVQMRLSTARYWVNRMEKEGLTVCRKDYRRMVAERKATTIAEFHQAEQDDAATEKGSTPRTPTQPTTCAWTQSTDPNMPDTYHAPCGVAWTFTEGGPVENDMHFCPKCGNHITQKGADHEPV
jgi:hypothetical protein